MKGLQGDDPTYLRVIATPKHFAVHSGPEPDRHTFDARPTERDLWETYLPAFRALVQEGKAGSVMSAYNRINGDSATASQRLLIDILRTQWGFTGYVVSGLRRGGRHLHAAQDRADGRGGVGPRPDARLRPRVRRARTARSRTAVAKGLVREADLDVALQRLFTARMKLGPVRSARDASAGRRFRTPSTTHPSTTGSRGAWRSRRSSS